MSKRARHQLGFYALLFDEAYDGASVISTDQSVLLLWEAETGISLLLARVSKSVNHYPNSLRKGICRGSRIAFRKPYFDSTCRRRKPAKISGSFNDIRY